MEDSVVQPCGANTSTCSMKQCPMRQSHTLTETHLPSERYLHFAKLMSSATGISKVVGMGTKDQEVKLAASRQNLSRNLNYPLQFDC